MTSELYFICIIYMEYIWQSPLVADGGVVLQIRKLTVNIVDIQSWAAYQERSSNLDR